MFSPLASISQQFPSCSQINFSDTTCTYNSTTCSCGYGAPNPSKADVTLTGLTIIAPSGAVYYLSGSYLPTSLTPWAINCASLTNNIANYLTINNLVGEIIPGYTFGGVTSGAAGTILSLNGSAIVYSNGNTNLFQANENLIFYFNGIQVATASVLSTGVPVSTIPNPNCPTCPPISPYPPQPNPPMQPNAANCFGDGCYTFQYDVYTSTNSNYTWATLTLARYMSITINGYSYNNDFGGVPTITQALAWLNGFAPAQFYTTGGTTIVVNDPDNIYGNILTWSAIPTTIATSAITGTSIFNSIIIGSTLYVIGNNITSANDIAAQLTALGLGTFTNTSGNISIPSGLFIANTDLSFTPVGGGTVTINLTGGTVTTTYSPVIVAANAIAGTYIFQQFLYCNITNQLNQFILSQYGQNCLNCSPTITQDIYNLIAQYQVMLTSINKCSGGGCINAQPYWNTLNASLNSLINQCS